MIHHDRLACPQDSEDLSRDLYADVFGLTELVKPPALAARRAGPRRGRPFRREVGQEAVL
ncbi:hypothetical protein [Micromonospora sp. LOL_024]|uniref:hypothetical protein n=1 Tax=Micromonospora sp. LOL_024 TaxID=3345412 RepID=UPI003A88C415